jgi:hypothetical protein
MPEPDYRVGTVFKRLETDEEYLARLQTQRYLSYWERDKKGKDLDSVGDYYSIPRRIIEDTSKVKDRGRH